MHLVNLRTTYRRRGLAQQQHQHGVTLARLSGRTARTAGTRPGNAASIAVQRAQATPLLALPNVAGRALVPDDAGPGQQRGMFGRDLG